MVLVWYHVAADALAIAESEPHRCFRRHMRRCAQRGRGAAPELWGESRACGLALCGFCRGGVHLIFVEEGLSIFCRRVRTTRKGCRAGCGGDGFWRRSAEAGAGRYCCCCCCCAQRSLPCSDRCVFRLPIPPLLAVSVYHLFSFLFFFSCFVFLFLPGRGCCPLSRKMVS